MLFGRCFPRSVSGPSLFVSVQLLVLLVVFTVSFGFRVSYHDTCFVERPIRGRPLL